MRGRTKCICSSSKNIFGHISGGGHYIVTPRRTTTAVYVEFAMFTIAFIDCHRKPYSHLLSGKLYHLTLHMLYLCSFESSHLP